MRKGFSLVEMIVVVGIIAVLAAVMMGTFSGGTESARTAKCLANMRSLAQGCQSYAMTTEHYPTAGSVEKYDIWDDGDSDVQEVYWEWPGWISWNSGGGTYGRDSSSRPHSSLASSGWMISTYNSDDEARIFCLTNGAIWKYVSMNEDVYRCPSHVKTMRKRGLDPNWSYVMNAYFGWTTSCGKDIYDSTYRGVAFGQLARADRILLFAEMPFADIAVSAKTTTAAGTDCDCILQYKGCEGAAANECIGFNHKAGKLYCANVIFADGHAEKLIYPKQGIGQGELEEITRWFCTGTDSSGQEIDVTFDGSKYNKIGH